MQIQIRIANHIIIITVIIIIIIIIVSLIKQVDTRNNVIVQKIVKVTRFLRRSRSLCYRPFCRLSVSNVRAPYLAS